METKKHGIKRPKSTSKYPRKNSTYVVAFALNETYDDLATAQQMICNRKSPKDSVSATSFTPVTETTRKDSDPSRILDLEHNSPESSIDTHVLVHNDNPYSPDRIDDKNQSGDAIEDMAGQPQVIFSAKHNKRTRNKKQDKDSKFTKRSNKSKGAFEIRNVHFKYRNNKITNINRLGKFYSKGRKNSVSDNLKFYTNSMTNVVSKTRILKKVSAKENLLDIDSLFDIAELEQRDMGSKKSSVSTVKQRSCASQNTLMCNSITNISNNNNNLPKGEDEPEATNSVINISSENTIPYKTDILNVAVAVTYTPHSSKNAVNKPCEDANMSLHCLSSSEQTEQSSASLTSNMESSSSKISGQRDLRSYDASEITLTASDNQGDTATDSDTYVVSKPASRSKTMLIPESVTLNILPNNTVPNIDNKRTFHILSNEQNINNKQALLDTVINLGVFSELNPIPSAESLDKFNELNKGNDKNTSETNALKNNGDHQTIKEKQPSVFQKHLCTDKTVNVQRNINLPSEDLIRNMLVDRENLQKKPCSEQVGTHPATISELWERIVVTLDLTVKRLEDNLAEKIVKELNKTSPAFEKLAQPIPDLKPLSGIEESLSAKPLTETITANESVQCDLVKKQMIDNIMLKLSIQNTKPMFPPSTSKIPLKIKKPRLLNDYVEVLKPPVTENADIEQGDTVTISTEFAPMEETTEYKRFDRIKSVLYVPISMVRENLVVIASITNFFVIMLCIYGFIMLVMKP